jgi:flagellar motor switch protein FliN/FliY
MSDRSDQPVQAQGIPATVLDSVPVAVEVILGVARVTVKDLLALQPGQDFVLDTTLGDLVELRINGAVVAHGELVAVDDHFGIRIKTLAGQ